jgi:effector-binding domain-containing protein
MSYAVREVETAGQPTAVVVEATTWESFPTLWPRLLDTVWAAVGSHDEIRPNRNVMLYKDDVPNVEVGVEVGEPIPALGRVVPSRLPAGRAATTTHRGNYDELGSAHRAIIEWCDRGGLQRVGPRWEIYGHSREGSTDAEVDVYYLVAPAGASKLSR